ncbi:amidase [Paenochrobactrum sp. BZR 588]|uniref:amidase n=1 Tax=unclassified Paenochrobactrum TaxID=2639760 RepID=UPI003853F179
MAVSDPYNAFVNTNSADVANAAHGSLSGTTLAVKDIFDVKGLITGCGNPAKQAESKPATNNAACVQLLLDQGAKFIGKTQTDELAFSLMGQNDHFPHPINPAAPSRVTGGSSSGSAAAVAGGLADIALGSDTGGSIRAPAAFCGLIGLRTTHGRISKKGAMPLAPSLDTVGWFAKDIDLYEKVSAALLGQDQHQTVLTKLFFMPILEQLLLNQQSADAYRTMFTTVRDQFTTLKPAAQPTSSLDELYLCFRQIQGAEAWASHGEWISSGDKHLSKGVAERFAYGANVSAQDFAAQRIRRSRFTAEFEDILGDDGVLVLPTVPGIAPLSQEPYEQQQIYREQALQLLCLSGLSGLPQITLPLSTVDDAPFGIALIGPRNSDMALIALAKQILHVKAS